MVLGLVPLLISLHLTLLQLPDDTMLITVVCGIRKHFFAERVVAPWNSLPADTDFSSLNSLNVVLVLLILVNF